MALERLQKILAAAGVASRRKAEEMITAGQVTVNGQVVTELGSKADLSTDHIRVDGKLLEGAERPVYIMLHKPKGHVTTVTDPEGRPTVLDLVKGIPQRVFPVGRLDYLSEGLLLLTNDGELMQKLTHASSHVPKTYMVKVAGVPLEEDLDKLRAGIMLPAEPTRAGTQGGTQPGMKRRSESVKTQPCEIELVKEQENPWYRVTLTEGRNRQIRRMFEQIRHHVEKIKRVRYGSLELDIEPGQFRFLSADEIGRLRTSLNRPYKIVPARPRPTKQVVKSDDSVADVRDRAAAPKREFKREAGTMSDRQRRAENRNTRERDESAPRPDSRFASRERTGARDDRPARREGGVKPREERAPSAGRGYRPREDRAGARPSGGAGSRGGFGKKREFTPREDRRTSGPRERTERTGGFDRPKREGFVPRERSGESRPKREGYAPRPRSAEDRPKREGFVPKREGFAPRERSGESRPRREGFTPRPRSGDDRPKREGFAPKREGFTPREGGFKPRSGGFKAREGSFKPREGGFKPRTGGFKPRDDRGERPARGPVGERGDRSSDRTDRPKRAGFGAKREGFAPRERSGSDFKSRSSSRGQGPSSRFSRPPSKRGSGRPPKKDQ